MVFLHPKAIFMKKIFGLSALIWGLLCPAVFAYGIAGFTDIPSTHPSFTTISFFAEKGVVAGYRDGTFKPYQFVNRAEVAKILTIYTNPSLLGSLLAGANCYTDVKPGDWFSPYVCGSFFINGYADGAFHGSNTITSAEALKMIYVANTGTYPLVYTPGGHWYDSLILDAKNKGIIAQNIIGSELVSRGWFLEMLYDFTQNRGDGNEKIVASKSSGTHNHGSYYSDKTSSSGEVKIDGVVVKKDDGTTTGGGTTGGGTTGGGTTGGGTTGGGTTGGGTTGGGTTGGGTTGGGTTGGGTTGGGTTTTDPDLQYSQRFMDAFTLGLDFLEHDLSSAQWGIYSNLGEGYSSSAVVGVNHEILSESYGLALTALAQAELESDYDHYYQFMIDHIIDPSRHLAVWKLNVDLSVYQYANAVIDDMRIIRGLLLGYEVFGDDRYLNTALEMADVMKEHGTVNNVLVSHVGWNNSPSDTHYFAADHLRLGYGDVATARKLATYDPDWTVIANATQAVLVAGQYPSGLFHFQYNHDSQTYSTDSSLQTIFQAYVGEYLAEAGETVASRRMLDFFKAKWESEDRIVSSYNSNGTSASSSQNLAVYGMVSRMAYHLGDRAFAEEIGDKLVSLLIDSPTTSSYYGAFAWGEGERIYAFNQGNALQTLALLGTTPSLAPLPPPTLEANQFALWQLSDIHCAGNYDRWVEMVEDMNTVPWTQAVVAGDISVSGTVTDFNSFLQGLGLSNHEREDFHIISGNHEYNCSGPASSGCLDNYRSLIDSRPYYSWDYGNIHFMMMSTDQESWEISDVAWAWLRTELAANQNKITIIVTHQMPHLFSESEAILHDYNIDFWLFGHAHCRHGDSACTRHDSHGDFYQVDETTFVNAGYIGNMESRYLLFTDGNSSVVVRSRQSENQEFQSEFEHTVTVSPAFDM
jgi:hypothetical protein